MRLCEYCGVGRVKYRRKRFCSRVCSAKFMVEHNIGFHFEKGNFYKPKVYKNGMLGKRGLTGHHIRGKTYEEYFGIDKAKEIKAKQSEKASTEERVQHFVDIGKNTRFQAGHPNYLTEESVKKISIGQIEYNKNPAVRLKKSNEQIKRFSHPEEVDKSRVRSKENWKNEEYANKIRVASLKLWEDPAFVKRVMARKPISGPERMFQAVIDENNFPYFYNGNTSSKILSVGRKVPDFVHKTDNKLIEIYGDFYHKGQNPQDRIDFFKKFGYDCLVIWASELKNVNSVIAKVRSFV